MLLKNKFVKYMCIKKRPFKENEDTVFLQIKGNSKDKYELYVRFEEENIAVGLMNALAFDKSKKSEVLEVLNELNSIEDNYIKFRAVDDMIIADTIIPITDKSVNFRKLEKFVLDFVSTLEMYLQDIYEVIE